MSLETIESKLARVAARLQREREECEVCEARNERAAIMDITTANAIHVEDSRAAC
jgi:hypothetical protein